MIRPGYVPDAGDLIWTDFDPTVGRGQAGRRPALVVSASGVHRKHRPRGGVPDHLAGAPVPDQRGAAGRIA